MCQAKPLSQTIAVEDTYEITDCQWIKIDQFLNDENASPFVKTLLEASLNKEGFGERKLEMFKNHPRDFELFF